MNNFSKILYHAQLEEDVKKVVSIGTYKKLGLPLKTYPRVYQGLPRCTKPGFPNNSFIKQEFSNQKTLRKRFIDSALLSLYRNAHLNKKHHIVILTHVIPDGLGDLYAQKTTYTLPKSLFPNFKFSLVTFIHKQTKFSHDQIKDPWYVYRYVHKKDLGPEKLDNQLFTHLRNASVVLQIPTYFLFFNELIKRVYEEKSKSPFPIFESVGEYGFINSKDFHPETDTRCLGLHFLEKGLFLDPNLDKKVRDQPLPKDLDFLIFSNTGQRAYRDKTRLFVAYLHTKEGYLLYLMLVLTHYSSDPKNMDILTIDIGKFLTALDTLKKNPKIFKTFGISRIELYFEKNMCPIKTCEKGKTLRIIHTGFLKHEHFTKLLYLSENPVGIRGNLSLTEAISLKKIYFYDMLEHNETLFNGLLSLAEKTTPKAYKYLKLCSRKNTSIEEISKSLKEAFSDFNKLNEHLLQNYNATYHLENLTYRALKHYEDKDLKTFEKTLLEDFSEKKETFVNLITKVQSKIKKSS